MAHVAMNIKKCTNNDWILDIHSTAMQKPQNEQVPRKKDKESHKTCLTFDYFLQRYFQNIASFGLSCYMPNLIGSNRLVF
jgi:hypothetical protein